jgi:hypothetical protein
MVAERLTVSALTTSLTEVLDCVREGEKFAIEQDGVVIATNAPPGDQTDITWGEFVATYQLGPRPDDRFADDLEAILTEREMLNEVPEWPD